MADPAPEPAPEPAPTGESDTGESDVPALVAGEIDPAPLSAVYAEYVRDGRVDYEGLSKDAEARAQLEAYLESAAAMDEQAAPLASWLNVYNAMVIQLVLERYPLDSVMSVPGFFKKLERPVAGKPRSLDAIENEVIRKRFPDARIHVALNCAAVSCPELSGTPFRQQALDAHLDALAQAAVKDPAHVRVSDGALHHSKIFEWFREDFVRDAGSVRAWIERYSDAQELRDLPADAPLRAMEYDWALADAR